MVLYSPNRCTYVNYMLRRLFMVFSLLTLLQHLILNEMEERGIDKKFKIPFNIKHLLEFQNIFKNIPFSVSLFDLVSTCQHVLGF